MAADLAAAQREAAAAGLLEAANKACPLNLSLIQGNLDDPSDDLSILRKPVKPMLDHIPLAFDEEDKRRILWIADDLCSEANLAEFERGVLGQLRSVKEAELALYNSESRLRVYEIAYATLEERKRYVKSELDNLRAEVAAQRDALHPETSKEFNVNSGKRKCQQAGTKWLPSEKGKKKKAVKSLKDAAGK